MVEIVYKYADDWPETGPLQVKVPAVTVEIPVSPDKARRRANGYIGMHIGILLGSSDPQLVLGDAPTWKLAVNFHLPHVGYVGQVGTIHVDAITGEVIPPSLATIHAMQERANELALRFPSAPEPAV
jgi:hypothetical protein